MNENQVKAILADVEEAIKGAIENKFYGNVGVKINFLGGELKNVNFHADRSAVYKK